MKALPNSYKPYPTTPAKAMGASSIAPAVNPKSPNTAPPSTAPASAEGTRYVLTIYIKIQMNNGLMLHLLLFFQLMRKLMFLHRSDLLNQLPSKHLQILLLLFYFTSRLYQSLPLHQLIIYVMNRHFSFSSITSMLAELFSYFVYKFVNHVLHNVSYLQ